MSIREPVPVGSEFDEYPQSIWELLVEMEFNPALAPDEMVRRQRAFWDRIVEALEGTGTDVGVGVEVFQLRGRGVQTPLFPLAVGSARFTSTLDISEIVERACNEHTALGEVAFDAAGQAYELDVEISFRRRPDLDGKRRPEMPRPEEVAALDHRRQMLVVPRIGGKPN